MQQKVPVQREAVILAILLHGEKFGREIRDNYQERTGHAMPLGSLYTTLDRMEQKGFVRSWVGESNPERGGNRRRYFKITALGISGLNELNAWVGIEKGVPSHG
jgi:DNA-binding PadR family transcriptional regulator